MVVKLQSHTSGSGKLVHKTLYGIQNSLRHFLTGNAHFQINFRMNTLSAETKMKVSKNFLPTMTKVIIAIVCSINFVLLLFNLSHILSKQFWAAIGPYIIMLFQNAFVFNDVFTKNDVSILIWLFSYTFLITISAAFFLYGKFPYFLPVASKTFNDLVYTKTEGLPLGGLALTVVCYLIVMGGYEYLTYFDINQQQILPMRNLEQSCLPIAVRNTPDFQQDSFSLPPAYSEIEVGLPTYREAIHQESEAATHPK